MNHAELAKKITSISKLTGNFKLRSGQISHEYFDKYRFEAQPDILREIASHLKLLVPKETEVLAGLELGGVPLATALSLETGIPSCFVRKSAKNYGTCQVAEGLELSGRRVCIVEDVITTGGQVLASTEDLRKLGAIVTSVICVILRAPETPPAFEQNQLTLFPLFTKNHL